MLRPGIIRRNIAFIFLCVLFSITWINVSIRYKKENPLKTGASSSTSIRNSDRIHDNSELKSGSTGVPQSWISAIQANLIAKEYSIYYHETQEEYQSPNRANNLRISYRPGQLSMVTRQDSLQQEKWKLQLRTRALVFNEGTSYHPTTHAKVELAGDTIEFHHEAFTEQYINNSDGVRQNFIIHRAPLKNTKEIQVEIEVTGLQPIKVNSNEVHFALKIKDDSWENKIIYKDLKAWDACGTLLNCHMETNHNLLALVVQTDKAVFPITIDPISTTIATQLERNQANANMGIIVASAGDVNGDGYSDVIVGAQSYDNGNTNEGAAFVYHGSATGLSTTVSTQLEGNQTNAYFAFKVASAGDVNGDGYSDVIVGADVFDNGQTDEGAAFVFHGSAAGITTTIQTQLEINQADARMGISVAGAGDVNGDGYSDVIVGAYLYDNGQNSEGAAFVFHGSAAGITTTIRAQLERNQADAQMGIIVASAGDVNGDGYSDVIVGARFYDNGQTDEGAAFVYHGSAAGISTTLSTQLESNQAYTYMGTWNSVACAGDVNGDGYSDVIVGASDYDNGQTDEGVAFIYHGSAAGITTTVQTLLERNQANAYLGIGVASAGDVNGDGYSDVIVGAWYFDNGQTNEGAAFVYHGSAAGITTTVQSQLECNQADAAMGYTVASAGDVNGDGYSDVIVGARYYTNGQTDEGAAFVYHGCAAGLSTTVGVQLERNQASADMGVSVASAGDVNGDGYSDVIVGAQTYDNGHTNEGAAFVYHGSATGLSTTVSTQLEGNQTGALFAYKVASAGDVNGDGYSDVIVGADVFDNGHTDEGAAFVYHGSAAGITTTIQTQLEINQADARMGISVAGAGDVNGDGYSDVIVGARLYDNGQTDEGAAFVYHGSAAGITTTIRAQLECNQANAQMGIRVASAGDVNGDGYGDVIVGARFYDNGETDEGAAFVYHGSATGTSTTVSTQLESNQAYTYMGTWNSIASAGDVNGDGYSDVIVGASDYDNGQTDEGVVFIYHGSAAGITTTVQTLLESNQASAYFGLNVASAGDVNGDGYSDVIVGAADYDNGQSNEGAAFVYHGSAAGITTTVQAQLECNQAGAAMGYSLASAGDVNGDGYSDVIVGARFYDNGQTDEGVVFVYYGNNDSEKRNNLRLYNTNLTSVISQSNFSSGTFGAGLYAKSFLGRNKGKLVWEVKKQGEAFTSGSALTNSVSYTSLQGSYSDLGTAGTELKNLVTKVGRANKIRARVAYDLTTAITGQKYGPWVYLPDYQEGKFGMTPTPLPIELVLFGAKAGTANVQLTWQTASERNNDYFVIEKSKSTKDWSRVATVKGAGNSTGNLFYATDDDHPFTGVSYYRLKQVDYDGAFSYSNIVSVEFNVSNATVFNVYPTLSSGEFLVALTGMKNEKIGITVQNLLAQKFYTKEFILTNDSFVEIINLSGTLASGEYVVIMSSPSRVISRKIIITN